MLSSKCLWLQDYKAKETGYIQLAAAYKACLAKFGQRRLLLDAASDCDAAFNLAYANTQRIKVCFQSL